MPQMLITATIDDTNISQLVTAPTGNKLSFKRPAKNPKLPDTLRWQEPDPQTHLSEYTQQVMGEIFSSGGTVIRIDRINPDARYGKSSLSLQLETVRKPVAGEYYFLKSKIRGRQLFGENNYRYLAVKFLGVQKRKLSWMDEDKDCRVFEHYNLKTGEVLEWTSYKWKGRWELGNDHYTLLEVETPRDAKLRVLKQEQKSLKQETKRLKSELDILKFKYEKAKEIENGLKLKIDELEEA